MSKEITLCAADSLHFGGVWGVSRLIKPLDARVGSLLVVQTPEGNASQDLEGSLVDNLP